MAMDYTDRISIQIIIVVVVAAASKKLKIQAVEREDRGHKFACLTKSAVHRKSARPLVDQLFV